MSDNPIGDGNRARDQGSGQASAPDERPRPEGFIQFTYNPMSPVQWGLVPFAVDVLVYSNATKALYALSYWVEKIWAHRESMKRGKPTFPIFYRGQSNITSRLLPTLLRGPGPFPSEPRRVRYATCDASDPHAAGIREEYGDWYEAENDSRSAKKLMKHLTAEWIFECGSREQSAMLNSMKIPEVQALDAFQQRATVRHYAEVPSLILDVSKDPKVAAWFATGGWNPLDRPIPVGRLGMIWAVDLNPLADLFEMRVHDSPAGRRIVLTQPKEAWGSNHQFFAEQDIPAAQLSFTDIELPFPRPRAQKGAFLTIADAEGRPLPIEAALHWWSLIERWSYATGFIHDGHIYEDRAAGVTLSQLNPQNDPLRALVGS